MTRTKERIALFLLGLFLGLGVVLLAGKPPAAASKSPAKPRPAACTCREMLHCGCCLGDPCRCGSE